jgi:threonyl-tRNA synthetase
LQLDFNLPERFGLEYIGPDGHAHQPVMIHRALFGSVERFFGVLVEHYAGAFPVWLSPVQARVLPVAEAHESYAREVIERLRAADLRADLGAADEPLGKRIRKAKLEKIPYVLVVGESDVAAKTLGVNERGAKDPVRDVPLDDFVSRMVDDVANLR